MIAALLSVVTIAPMQQTFPSEQGAGSVVSPADSAHPGITKIGQNLYRLGNVTIDSERRQISMAGKVNMDHGIVELLACAPGGKVHESVLVLDVVPYHFQVALLLLGLKPGGGLEYQGDPRTPTGDSVDVIVSWTQADTQVSVRAEQLVWDLQQKTAMQTTPWIFVGSKVVDGTFLADVERSLITTYHDPTAILDNPLPSGGNDEISVVNRELIPPVGTPVVVTVRVIAQNGRETGETK
jgi:hypothetical protein